MRSLTIPVVLVALTSSMSPGIAQSLDLEARVAMLERKVANLQNSRAIERLYRAYGYYFDKGLWKDSRANNASTRSLRSEQLACE